MQHFQLLLRRAHISAVLAIVAPTAVMVGCSGEDAPARLPESELQPGAGGGGGNGGGAADAGDKDAGRDGGGSGGGDADVVDEGDAGDASPDGPVEYPVSDVACERDVAFRSSSISFVSPTALAFGRELEQFLAEPAGPNSYSFVLTLRGSKKANADGAISAATTNQEGSYVFPVGPQKPTLVPVSLKQGSFASEVQVSGFLTFKDWEQGKNKTIHLVNLQFSAFTRADCQEVVAIIDATLPVSEAGKEIWSDGQPHTVGDLAGMKDGNGNWASVPIRFVMRAEATNFDFSSL